MAASSKTKAVSRWLVTAAKRNHQPVSTPATECAFTKFMAELNQKIELTHITYSRGGLQL